MNRNPPHLDRLQESGSTDQESSGGFGFHVIQEFPGKIFNWACLGASNYRIESSRKNGWDFYELMSKSPLFVMADFSVMEHL